jgi:alpha-tubulin suppressor-like RCC1 family protein
MSSRVAGIGVALVMVFGAVGCGGGGKPAPAPALLSGVAAVTAGGSHACALLTDGTARCWGSNAFGELGDGQPFGTDETGVGPVRVALSGIAALAAGGGQTCALLADGTVSCWGNDQWGELGSGPRTLFDSTPTPVPGLAGAVGIAATGRSPQDPEVDDEYSCALGAGGQPFCWGADEGGELGDGGNADFVLSPVAVVGVTGATQLALGGQHACALLADQTATCWGSDLAMSEPTPTAVAGLTSVAALAAGALHTCALLRDGTVSCWGDNTFGQLGTGTTSFTPTAAPGTPVSGLGGVTAIAAGGDHTCALLGDGTVRCWGLDTDGELGDGKFAESSEVPTPVVGLSGAVAISAGVALSCALLDDTTVRCWGENESSQTGTGSPSSDMPVSTPTGVVAGSGADGGSG